MRVSRISALLITAMMIPAVSGCTTQGSPAPDAVHQIEDGGPAVYDDDPIAVEPQLDEDELDGDSDESNVQGGEHFGGTASRECGVKKVIAVISAKGGAGHEV
mgnify:CR=1 FL=1